MPDAKSRECLRWTHLGFLAAAIKEILLTSASHSPFHGESLLSTTDGCDRCSGSCNVTLVPYIIITGCPSREVGLNEVALNMA